MAHSRMNILFMFWKSSSEQVPDKTCLNGVVIVSKPNLLPSGQTP